MSTPPDGFEPYDRRSPITDFWAPLFQRIENNRVTIGLFVAEQHCNSRLTPHGGMIATLSDNCMGISCGLQMRADDRDVSGLWTTSLSVDYLGKAELGQWLTFETVYVETARNNCFAEANIAADGRTIARARAVFRAKSAAKAA